MAGVNKVILVGNLGKDPVVRATNDGSKIVSFSLATSESWRDKATGERKEKTEWHNIVIFNENIGKIAEQYLRKGSKVFVEGQMQTRKWTDKDNQEKYTTEVVVGRFKGELTLLDSRNEGGGGGSGGGYGGGDYSGGGGNAGGNRSSGSSAPSRDADFDDDIPF
jgi:single-strand DNA-binding protein